MAILFIGSTGDQAGHSLLTWAVGRRLLEKGWKVGFFKPFGTPSGENEGSPADPDALLFKDAFNLQDPPECVCPHPWSEGGWVGADAEEVLEGCKVLAKRLSKGKDVLLVTGSECIFLDDASPPVSDLSLARALNADFLLIHRYRNARDAAYTLLSVHSLLKDALKGIVVNRAPPEELQTISQSFLPSLARKGVRVIAAIPEVPMLSVRNLREIVAAVKGEVLWGKDRLDRPVGRWTSGSSALRGKALLFKRLYNKIIVLGTLSPDASSEEASVAAVLLTAGSRPPLKLLEAAKAEDIPLISVQEDTFSALARLEQSPGKLDPQDQTKVNCLTEWLDRGGALERILLSLG